MLHDLVGQGPGGGGWYRLLRFGQGASGPYWVAAAAVTVSGATPDLPQGGGAAGRAADHRGHAPECDPELECAPLRGVR